MLIRGGRAGAERRVSEETLRNIRRFLRSQGIDAYLRSEVRNENHPWGNWNLAVQLVDFTLWILQTPLRSDRTHIGLEEMIAYADLTRSVLAVLEPAHEATSRNIDESEYIKNFVYEDSPEEILATALDWAIETAPNAES